VKREDNIGPAVAAQRAVGTGLSLDLPDNLAESGKYEPSFLGGQLLTRRGR